jgi:lycopene cyclase domain-containing protein
MSTMESLRYLAVLAACIAVTLPLEFGLGARVYRRPRLLAATLAPVLVVFVACDAIATARGDWWFAQRYLIGVWIAGLPVEEWLFFLVVPVCAVLTYEALGVLRVRRPRRGVGGGDDHA